MDASDRMAIHTEVLEALAAVLKFDPRQFKADLTLADSGVDSLGLVEAVFVIEDRFDISLPFNANVPVDSADASFGSLGQLLDQIVDLVVAKRVPSLATEPV